MEIRRRELIAGAALSALAGPRKSLAGKPPASSARRTPVPPIIDTHQHLWDLDKFTLSWLKNNKHLQRSFVSADYRKAAEGLNVVKAVYMEVAVRPDQHAAEAEHVIGLCRRKEAPTCAAVIGGRVEAEGFKEYITRFSKAPEVKGVRQWLPQLQAGSPEEKRFVAGLRLLGKLGLRFDLLAAPARLPDCARLAGLCPDTRFILDHCGNPDATSFAKPAGQAAAQRWRKDLAVLAGHKNVVCKISGVVARAPEKWTHEDLAPIVDHCIDTFGPDRVMFGGDWPVCRRRATLRQWVEALKKIIARRPPAQQKKLLHDNAEGFYGLK